MQLQSVLEEKSIGLPFYSKVQVQVKRNFKFIENPLMFLCLFFHYLPLPTA